MTSALEKKEARFGPSYVLLIASLFLPSIGTCGGIGAFKAHLARAPVVPTAVGSLANEVETPAGTYVETSATLRFEAEDELPLDARTVAVSRGSTLLGVVEEPKVVVHCGGDACAGLREQAGPVRIQGQLCDGDEKLRCSIPTGLEVYLRSEKRKGAPRRVLLAGADPREHLWEAAIGLGIAALLIAGVAGIVFATTRARRSSAHLVAERSVTLPDSADAVRSALRSGAGPSFRLAEDGGDHLIFLAGAQASRARFRGVKSPDDVPRRVDIRFQPQAGAYRSVLATITVTEILPFPKGVPTLLRPTVQAALDQTLAGVEQMMRGSAPT